MVARPDAETTHMTSTVPPPPKSGGSGAFIAAAAVMLLVMGGLIWWKTAGDDPPQPAAPAPAPQATATEAPVLDQPPPPPPPPEEEPEDAGTKQKKVVKPSTGGGGGGCASPCNGTAPAQLRATLHGKGGLARSCYERALRQNATLKGRMSGAVRVGPVGQACSVSIAQNSLGDPGIAACVRQIFQSGTYPAPQGGCVDTVVPLNFVPRQ